MTYSSGIDASGFGRRGMGAGYDLNLDRASVAGTPSAEVGSSPRRLYGDVFIPSDRVVELVDPSSENYSKRNERDMRDKKYSGGADLANGGLVPNALGGSGPVSARAAVGSLFG